MDIIKYYCYIIDTRVGSIQTFPEGCFPKILSHFSCISFSLVVTTKVRPL